MQAGSVFAAVTGGVVGLAYALLQDHGFLHSLIAYQAGGMLAFGGYVATLTAVAQRAR